MVSKIANVPVNQPLLPTLTTTLVDNVAQLLENDKKITMEKEMPLIEGAMKQKDKADSFKPYVTSSNHDQSRCYASICIQDTQNY